MGIGGQEDIQLVYSNRSGPGGIDPYARNNCNKLFKRGGKLYKNNAELPSVFSYYGNCCYLEGIANLVVCYGSCDWVSLMNTFALYGFDQKLA